MGCEILNKIIQGQDEYRLVTHERSEISERRYVQYIGVKFWYIWSSITYSNQF